MAPKYPPVHRLFLDVLASWDHWQLSSESLVPRLLESQWPFTLIFTSRALSNCLIFHMSLFLFEISTIYFCFSSKIWLVIKPFYKKWRSVILSCFVKVTIVAIILLIKYLDHYSILTIFLSFLRLFSQPGICKLLLVSPMRSFSFKYAVYGYTWIAISGFHSCNRDYVAQNLNAFTIRIFIEKVCWQLF